MSTSRGKLGDFLREVIDWQWDQFIEAEADSKYTSLEGTVLSLVRVCSEGKLGAIRLAIDRIDGKLETPVKVEYPKIYFLYPQATTARGLPEGEVEQSESKHLVVAGPEPKKEEPERSVVTFTLRETLEKMADQKRVLVDVILDRKERVEKGEKFGEDANIPLVKSVIAANLLNLALQGKNFDSITEVFDQIDGKLVETIKILGEDIFLTSYLHTAPFGAIKNTSGIYQLEAPSISGVWEQKWKQTSNRR